MAIGAISRKVVYSKGVTLTIASTTSARRFTLPDEAIITRVMAFTAATSTGATLNVGTAADDNLYIAALDVSVLGSSEGTILNVTKLTTPTDIYMNIGGAPAGGGGFTVFVEFTSTKSTGPK